MIDWLADAYATKGDKDKALAAMQKSFEMGFNDFTALDSSAYFSALRAEPRFQQMVARFRK